MYDQKALAAALDMSAGCARYVCWETTQHKYQSSCAVEGASMMLIGNMLSASLPPLLLGELMVNTLEDGVTLDWFVVPSTLDFTNQ